MENLFYVGIIFAVVGQGIISLGLILQKKAHIREMIKHKSKQRPYLKNISWIIGFGIFQIGNGLTIVALAFGAQSVISALSSLVLVYNAFFAPWLLGEKVNRREIFATILLL